MDSEINRQLLTATLLRLRHSMAEAEQSYATAIAAVQPENRESLRNLVHYLAMRRRDLHEVQLQLAALGLSSLGRSEGFVLDNLNRVLHHLGAEDGPETSLDWAAAERLLHRNTRALLGEHPRDRHVLIMITSPLPDEADAHWMEQSLRAGMNVLRINCAHGSESDWEKLIAALRDAEKKTGLSCRLLMDIAGPKLRTGPVHGGAEILRLRVERDIFGRVSKPARVTVGAQAADLTFPQEFCAQMRAGDTLQFHDSRGKKRRLRLEAEGDGFVGLCESGAYILRESRFTLRRGKKEIAQADCGALPFVPGSLLLKPDDYLVLFAGEGEGFPAEPTAPGVPPVHARIGCTLGEAVAAIRPGERVLFDDGKIGTVCVSMQPGEVLLRIVRAKESGSRLRGEKGINLPDSKLKIPAITEKDREDLVFVLEHADIVGASFIHSSEDVAELQQLVARSRRNPGILLKIETQAGFHNLPVILMQALSQNPVGVMIARGDLAVEAGFERLAEVQEEILWICEAAHVPVVWATQVLENLAQTGQPSRAEITDAAMSVRAECVMLNKGPYIHEATAALTNILKKMEKHQYKKRSLYRPLQIGLG
ncbi:MAG TPA: pyruvate kinase [Turneriella sp.]|nr:pyruvate kinase [Turneriella sp.]